MRPRNLNSLFYLFASIPVEVIEQMTLRDYPNVSTRVGSDVADSNSRDSSRTQLGNEAFWEKYTSEPPVLWRNKKAYMKLALLAKVEISLPMLWDPTPKDVVLPSKPI